MGRKSKKESNSNKNRSVNWQKWKYFYYVGKCRKLSTAAKELNLRQSCLSRHIVSLEQDIGLKLFTRRVQGLELTEDGRILFETVKEIPELIAEGDKILCEEKSHRKENRKIGNVII